ncbi:MAG: EAL domain-containing protein [Candidatus Accumulibacter sp.]|nr:EAL domain-containing protein [Accumulibacter sp.]
MKADFVAIPRADLGQAPTDSPAKRILIVEDDQQLAALLALHLGAAGYATVQAFDAAAAIAAARQGVCDLVVMDILLPGKVDGLQAAEMIHQHFDLPVVMLSAVNPEQMLGRLLAAGAYGFIRKPWNENMLHVTIELALERHRGERRRNQQDALLRRLFAATARKTGQDFFTTLATELALGLQARAVLIDELLTAEPTEARMLAGWIDGRLLNGGQFPTAGSATGEVAGSANCVQLAPLGERVSGDARLADLAAASYLGVPLNAADGTLSGVLAVISDAPVRDEAHVRLLLEIFASRAGAELERQRAAAALAAGEGRYRSVLETAADAILLVDAQGTIMLANTSAELMFGYRPGALQGMCVDLLVPAAKRAAHRAHRARFDAQPRHGSMRAAPLDGQRRDGSVFPAEVSLSYIGDTAGRLVTCAVRDVSERDRQSLALRRLNASLRLVHACNAAQVRAGSESEIVAAVVDLLHRQGGYSAVWVDLVGADGQLLAEPAASAAAASLAGIRWHASFREQLSLPALEQGQALTCLFGAADGVADWIGDVADRGQRGAIALPLINRGVAVGVLNLLSPDALGFDDDACEILEELADDLAYGILAQRAVAGMLLLQRAVDASANGVMITDAVATDHPITYVNPGFEAITGYKAGEVLGGSGRFLLGDARDQLELNELRQALRERRGTQVTLRCCRKDGSLLWTELNVSPVFSPDGKLGHYVSVFHDISEHRRYEEELEHQANHDSLTGLANRNLLRDRQHQAIAYAQRHGARLAVLAVDVDQFSRVNNSLGHGHGDELLRVVAERLADTVRDGDTVARLGGDEFVMILADPLADDELARVITRILERVALPVEVDGHQLTMSCTIGASVYPRDGGDPDTLLQNADTAMHRAKLAARGSFHFYQAEMNDRVADQLLLEADLAHAVERAELELHYQPQLDLLSGEIVGAEALLRWRHPSRGMIAPDDFITLAEDSGLIVPIGGWVLDTACQQARTWLDAGLTVPRVAVNLSARQFQSDHLAEQVAAAVARAGLAAGALEIELTESLALQELGRVNAMLRRIRAAGVTTAIDDFGTGFSSLSQLMRITVDRIKIDRCFVRGILTDRTAAAVSLAVIAMARSLGVKVIAEGVETEGQLNFLRARGCDEMQGFYFSRPLPADEFAALLREAPCLRFDGASTEDGEDASRTLLLVDDEASITSALRRVLRADRYRVFTATSGGEGLEILARHRVGVIITDQRMPGMSGTEFISRARALFPEPVRMILSGYTDLQSVTEAVNQGEIYRFMTKPWNDAELREAVRDAFARYRRDHGGP